jgi:hypothetical protein
MPNPLKILTYILLSPIIIPAYFLASTENVGTPEEERVFRVGSFSIHFESNSGEVAKPAPNS